MTPTETLLPLDVWRARMDYHPFHFWQFADNNAIKLTSNCNTLVREYAYQDAQAVGREDVRQAIASAERLLTDYLGYAPAPRYTSFTVPWPRWHDESIPRIQAIDATGRWLGVQLPEGQIQAIGTEQRTLLGTPTITPSDSDGDGINDTFTATLTVAAGLDTSTVAAYFAANDRLGEAISEAWRIRPITVALSGTTLTITGRCWLVARPIKYQGFGATTLNPQDTASYVETIEVYSRTTNAGGTDVGTSQAVIIWETAPCHGWWCLCGCNTSTNITTPTNDPAAQAMAIARCGIRDSALGIVTPAQSLYDATTGYFSAAWPGYCKEPDRVTVRALAGCALDASGNLDPQWAEIITRLAAAELARKICACDQANAKLYHYQFDLARTAGANDEQYATSQEILSCPFGTRRGAVWAWKQVLNRRNVTGYLP